jgi:hypothetical protein
MGFSFLVADWTKRSFSSQNISRSSTASLDWVKTVLFVSSLPDTLLSSEETHTAGTNKKMNKKKGPHTLTLINAPEYFDFNKELFIAP